MKKNKIVCMLGLAFFFLTTSNAQTIIYIDDSLPYRGVVDTLWLYNKIRDTSLCNPKYKGLGYYRYNETNAIQSIFKVLNGDSIGYVIQFDTKCLVRTYQEYCGIHLCGLSYFIDEKGNLDRMVLFKDGYRQIEYIVKKNRIRYIIDHTTKKGTKKKLCRRKLKPTELNFYKNLLLLKLG